MRNFCAISLLELVLKRLISTKRRKPNNRVQNWNIWLVNNGNWTEWSAIWAEIICLVSRLNERTARVRFEITSVISDQNCTTRGSVTTLLHPFWNRSNTGLSSNILLMQYWAGLKLNSSFFGGKNNSFGNKSSKVCQMINFVSHFPAIWSVTLNKPWNLIGCLF